MLHLIHPALVHFTVAFIVAGSACEGWGLLVRREGLARRGGELMLAGAVSLVATIVSGYLAANTVRSTPAGRDLLWAHERNGWILAGLLVACLFWKAARRGRLVGAEAWSYAALLLAVLVTTCWSAWLGGRLVYGEGIGVMLGGSG